MHITQFGRKILQQSWFPVLLLVSIAIISHLAWFTPGVITFEDFWHRYDAELIEIQTTWRHNDNFGEVNFEGYKNIFFFPWTLLTELGFPSELSIRILLFWPIAFLGFLAPYFLGLFLSKNRIASFVAALFYASTTTFLMRQFLGHEALAFVVAITPLVFLLFLQALKTSTWTQWLYFLIGCWVMFSYEPRAALLSTAFIGSYVIVFNLKLLLQYQNIFRLLFIMAAFFILSLYWILPFLFGNFWYDAAEIAGRELFGNPLYSLQQSFTVFHHAWTGNFPTLFEPNLIPFYFWLLPIMAVYILLCSSRFTTDVKSKLLFYSTILLIGVLLTKQVAEPLPGLLIWLRENVPLFEIYRSASKFYILLMLGYFGIFLYGLSSLLSNRKSHKVGIALSTILIILSFINLKPLIFGDIEGIFSIQHPHIDYQRHANQGVRENTAYKELWLPFSSRWGLNTSYHTRLNYTSLVSKDWEPFCLEESTLATKEPARYLCHENAIFWNDLLDASSIKYVSVPIEGIPGGIDTYEPYGIEANNEIRDWYVRQLQEVDYLEFDPNSKDLATFENADYQPNIRPLTSLLSYESMDNFDLKYTFTTETLGKAFDFYITDSTTNISVPATHVARLFEDADTLQPDRRVIYSELSSSTAVRKLYADSAMQNREYLHKDDVLTIRESYTPSLRATLGLVDTKLQQTTTSTVLSLEPDQQYAVVTGALVTPLVPTNEWTYLGRPDADITILSVDSSSLRDGSFERSTWQKIVGDCHKYDDNPILHLQQTTEAYDGQYALELSATRHNACVKQSNIPVSPGQYRLSLAYQAVAAERVGFYLNFGDAATAITGRLPAHSTDWQTFEQVITVPAGARAATMFLYAYESDGETPNTVRYDAVQLQRLEEVATISASKASRKSLAGLIDADEQLFSYREPYQNLENIIPNGSFSDGLWQEKVGDCHNYDVNPILDMQLEPTNQALELSATRHNACTGPGVLPVVSGERYLLEFEYRNAGADQAGFYLGFNDTERSSAAERFTLTEETKGWQTHAEVITIPDDATTANLLVYAYQTNGRAANTVQYDNFSLTLLPDVHDRFYVVEEQTEILHTPQSVDFTLVNPAKKLVSVSGATTSFYLAMSESYHPKWQAQFNNHRVQGLLQSWLPFVRPNRISDEHHFELNSFLNGWYVDIDEHCIQEQRCTLNEDGTYDLELVLEFFPQRWFYLGLFISTSTLIGILGYLLYPFISRRIRSVVHK